MLKVAAYQKVAFPEKVTRPAAMPTPTAVKPGPTDFKATLNQAVRKAEGVQFSAHARARLHSRGVVLDQAKLEALSKAIDKAEAKGARESLVLSDEAAYVVSVTNRTVISAFDRDNLRDGVFTAIDSAVIL